MSEAFRAATPGRASGASGGPMFFSTVKGLVQTIGSALVGMRFFFFIAASSYHGHSMVLPPSLSKRG